MHSRSAALPILQMAFDEAIDSAMNFVTAAGCSEPVSKELESDNRYELQS